MIIINIIIIYVKYIAHTDGFALNGYPAAI